MLLAGDAPLASRYIPACIETDGADTDALMLSQWEINTQREAIPEVDFALLVRDTYRSMFDKVRANRDAICAAHKIAQTGRESDSDLAITLAIKEVDRLSGRPLQRRAVLQLTQCADKLAESAVRLARAYRFSQRSLAQLARLSPADQTKSAERLASPTVAVAEPAKTNPARPGRPTLADRELRLCNHLIDRLIQRNPKQLARLAPDDMHKLLQAVADAREALDDYASLLGTLLKKPAASHAGGN